MLVDHQEERIQTLEGQLDWVQNCQALCPCIRSKTLTSVHKGLEEESSEGLEEGVPVSSTSCPVSMMALGSFCWGSEVGTAVGEAWGQELDEKDGVEDEDTFMVHQVQVFKANEAERKAIKWLAANPTCYEPVDSGSSVDVDHIIDLFKFVGKTLGE